MFFCPSPNLLRQASVIDGWIYQDNILAATTNCSTYGAPEVTAEMNPDLSLHAQRPGLLHGLLKDEHLKLALFSN